jgi:hypothetical protein
MNELSAKTKREHFNIYADLWKDQTRFLSCCEGRVNNAFFHAMFRMGSEAAPWAFERLKTDVFFHLLLQEWFGFKDFEANGVMQKIQDGWLQWGRGMGLVPPDPPREHAL